MSPAARAALLYSRSNDDCQVLSAWLGELGIPLVPEPDSDQMLATAREQSCQFVLMNLDDEPGWQATLREIRRLAPATEVVVYTRRADVDVWLSALEAGAFDLLSKPLRRTEVEGVVANLRRERLRSARSAA